MLKVINNSVLETLNSYLLKNQNEKNKFFIKIHDMIEPKLNKHLKQENIDNDDDDVI